ncbi:MAG: hypothetical protein AB1750_11540 [Chloroflexota bacterium]
METQQPQSPSSPQGPQIQPPVYDPAAMAEMERRTAVMNVARQVKSGASNFYWIAGLSVINSLVTIFGGGFYFVMGLGVTLVIDSVAKGISEELGGNPVLLGMGFLFSLVFDLIFVGLGYFAVKGRRWAFIAGMVLYGLDAVLMLVFQDWLGFGFHLFFMWGIWQGLNALGRLKALEPKNPMAVPPAETMR